MSASAIDENDWQELGRLAASVDLVTRTRIAELWTTAARYEHASIASFARFSLQLLSLGAPPGLLEGAQRAALDEIEHARLSFRVASIYAGTSLGPGPLPLARDAFADFSLHAVLREAVEEGCVGETLAAGHAELLMAHVRGKALRTVYATVQRDESRHAALAYQLARWALTAFGAEAREIIERSFADAIAKLERTVPSVAPAPELLVHGQLGEVERNAANLRALREVVEPMRRELLTLVTGRT